MKRCYVAGAAVVLALLSGCATRTPAAPLLGALGGAGIGAAIGNQVRDGHDQKTWALGGSILGLAAGTGIYLAQEEQARRYDYRSAYQPPPPAPVYNSPSYYGAPPAYSPPPSYNYYNNGYRY